MDSYEEEENLPSSWLFLFRGSVAVMVQGEVWLQRENSVLERLWRAEDLSWIGIEMREVLVEREQVEHLRSIRLSRNGTE